MHTRGPTVYCISLRITSPLVSSFKQDNNHASTGTETFMVTYGAVAQLLIMCIPRFDHASLPTHRHYATIDDESLARELFILMKQVY